MSDKENDGGDEEVYVDSDEDMVMADLEMALDELEEEEEEEDEDKDEDILDLCELLHDRLHLHWSTELETQRKTYRRIKTRGERAIESSAHRGGLKGRSQGDVTLDGIQNLFYNGMDMTWSDVQVDIFNIFVDTCLPKIYGVRWPEHMARVLRVRKLKKIWQEALVNLGRRNGKTYVTAGTAAVLLLTVPGISVAVFSTGERTARMLMDEIRKMIKRAFKNGTIVKESDFTVIQSNKEVLLMEGPDGTRRLLGCYPGSVRVSNLFCCFFFACVCVCMCIVR